MIAGYTFFLEPLFDLNFLFWHFIIRQVKEAFALVSQSLVSGFD